MDGRGRDSCTFRWDWGSTHTITCRLRAYTGPQIEILWDLDNFSLSSLNVFPTGVLANGNHLEHLCMSVDPLQHHDGVMRDANDRVRVLPPRSPSPTVPWIKHQF